MAKWVYSFGNGTAEGRAEMRNLLGRQGRQPRRDDATSACRCRPASRSRPSVCTYYYANNESYPAELEGRGRGSARCGREDSGRRLRRREQPAARLGPLRRARLDARHDGHHPQPRPQRPHRAGAGQVVRRRALRLGLLPPLHPDVLRRRARTSATTISKKRSRLQEGGSRRPDGHRPQGGRLARGGHEYKKIVEKRTGKPFPQEPREQLWGAIGAVFGSWKNQRAITYRRLHQIPEAGAPPSTCRPWCSATWATIAPPASPSRAIPSTGDERVLRRVSAERAGRGCRGRHPHAAASHHRGQERRRSPTRRRSKR